ncbi:hypothetical protein JT255_06585 [Helicobacter pylori]|nr:hypothetical protein [Helicobacter pylori]
MKHPNAKDDWASSADVGGEFGSCSVCLIIGILQSLSPNAFPTGLTHHIYKGVTLRTSYARYKCRGVLYYKDIWDFCLGGLKNEILVTLFLPFGGYRLTKLFYILITENAF